MDGEKEVTCNVDIKPLANGEYILTHAVFLDDERNYLLVTSEIIIKNEFPPLSIEEQDKNQTIENFSNWLVVKVSDEFYDDYCPTLYYDKNDKIHAIISDEKMKKKKQKAFLIVILLTELRIINY